MSSPSAPDKTAPAPDKTAAVRPPVAASRSRCASSSSEGERRFAATRRGGQWVSGLARWLLWMLLILLPLAIWPRIPSVSATHIMVKSAILGLWGGGILLLAAAALLFERGSAARAGRWMVSPGAWGFAALAATIGAAAWFSPERAHALAESWFLLTPLALGAACGWIFRTETQVRRTAALLVLGGTLVAALGLLDAAGIVPLFRWTAGGVTLDELIERRGSLAMFGIQGGATRGRLLSTLGNPAYVGGFLVIPIVLLGCWLASGWDGRRPGWKASAAGWAMLTVMAATLVATATREAWIGVLLGIAARAVLARRTAPSTTTTPDLAAPLHRQPWLPVAAMLLGLLALLALFSTPNPINRRGWNVAERFVELTDPRSDSIRERLLFYTLGGRMFAQRPLLGWGPGQYGPRFYPTIESFLEEGPRGPWDYTVRHLKGRVADRAHNEFVQFAAECGILGLGALLWLLAALGVAAVRCARTRAGAPHADTVRILASAWIAGLFTLLTSFPLHTPARALYFWTMTGLLAALLAGTLRTTETEESVESR